MNRRDYFLACLNVQIACAWNSSAPMKRLEVADVQYEAWRVPEEAIPIDDPARAARDFFDYYFGSDGKKPEWLAAWEESLTR